MLSRHSARQVAGFLRRALKAVALLGLLATGPAALAQANTPPAGYARCAGENQFCDFDGAASVVYGAGTTWTAPRTFTGYTVSCSNYTFGDPLPNMSKACYAKAVDTPPPPPPQPTVDTPPAGYTRCAGENGRCSFTGTTNVVYGALGSWTAPRSFTNGTACTNNIFGDPAYGKAKSCYRQDTAAVAKVNLNLTIAGTGGVGFSDGGSCSANCSKPFDSGSSVTLAATASAGHNFTGWGGACGGSGATCTVSMSETRNVTATFVPAVATRALTVTVAGGGKVLFADGSACAANCTKTFANGSNVTVSATADAGYTFAGWGSACSGTAGCTVTMDAAKSVSANFNAVVAGGTDAALGLTACLPSGKGTDYQVGPNAGQLASLGQVPWEKLAAGDTVRIFHRAAAYPGKFHLSGNGTAAAPVRVCGVRGPNGERPVITGQDAVTAVSLQGAFGTNNSEAEKYNESRGVIFVGRRVTQDWKAHPTHIQIDGLSIKSAAPNYAYTNAFGVKRAYIDFGACIWIDRGQNVTVADNEVSDCTNGVFSRSTEDGDFAVTKNVRLAGNHIHSNGVVGDEHQHNTYMQSVGVVYEFNRYGPPRAGALGNALKDRSVGAVIRYNRIEEGARALDLVEAEDFPATAMSLPAYRTTYAYGNQIVKTGNSGSFIHYGGDHSYSTPGASWGEPIFRKGTLYFFNNTIYAKGSYAALFQLSTTEERAEIWNNVFYFAPTVTYPSMRQSQDIGNAWVKGGILNFGRNWINANWSDTDPWHTIPGELINTANLIKGTAAPIDLATLAPLAGSAVIDAGLAGPAAASAYTVNFQLDGNFKPKARGVLGGASDLGAIEGAGTTTPTTATLTVTAASGGSVSSSPAGIQCGSTCSASFANGTQVALTATPAAGHTFSGWSGACSGAGACSVKLDVARNVSAGFTAVPAVPTTKALTVTWSGLGGVGFSDGSSCASSPCTKSFNTGASVVLAASPSSGYTFSGWGGGTCSGTGSCTVTMDVAKSVTATFVPVVVATQSLTVTVTGSGKVQFSDGSSACTANCTKTFNSGSSVVLSASPDSGHTFSGWGSACSGTGDCTVAMNASKGVTATFNAVAASVSKTYYVDANAPNDDGDGTAALPKKYLSSGAGLLSKGVGDTLIVKPGIYGNLKDKLVGQGAGKSGGWNVIKAAIDGTVTITVPIDLAEKTDHYLQLEGLKWEGPEGKGVSGNYVKILRCAFKGGPMSGNTMNLAIGTNNQTPGAQHILIEDSYFYGVGGRYNVLVYNADSVVLRRLVVRHEAGWADVKNDPEAGIALYNSTNVLTQNLVVLDSKGGPTFTAGIYHPSNSRASEKIRNTGAVVLNTNGTGIGWDDGATVTGMTLEDSAVIGSASIGVSVNGGVKNVELKNVTIVRGREYGTATYGGNTKAANFSIADSIVAVNTKGQFNGPITVSNVSGTEPPWPTQRVGTTGATIMKRLGKSGTLYGELGYNQVQNENLWPFPNEAAIKAAMCTGAGAPTTGLCAAPTLTRYVWEALGTPIPAGIYTP